MGEVVDFKTRAKLATRPVPDGTPDGGQSTGSNTPTPVGPSAPVLAGCLVLACPCGSCSMELWAHGVIVCARCQRLCGSAVWEYTNRQGPPDAERTAMPAHTLPPAG